MCTLNFNQNESRKKCCLHWNIVGIEWEKPATHTRRMFAHISLATKYDWIQRQTEMGQKWASGFFMIWTLKCNKFYQNGKNYGMLDLMRRKQYLMKYNRNK